MLTRNRVNIERTVANVKDATDWGSKLVQKIYANPFVLSPLYKPTPEDIRVQSVYDSAQVFSNGAMKLDDAVKTLEALSQAQLAPAARELDQVRRQIAEVTGRLGQLSQQFSEAMKPQSAARNRRGSAN